MTPPKTRICNHCRLELPADQFRPNTVSASGKTATCRACYDATRKAGRDAKKAAKAAGQTVNVEAPPKEPEGFKRCRSCGHVKPLDDFHKSRRGVYGVHSWCKACCAAKARNRTTRQKARANEVRKVWQYRKDARLVPESALKDYFDALRDAEAEIEKLKTEVAKARQAQRAAYLAAQRDRRRLASERAKWKEERAALAAAGKDARS